MKMLLKGFVIPVMLLSCSSNEEIFTEELKVEIPVVSTSKFAPGGFRDISLVGKTTIQGFTEDFYFRSDDVLSTYVKSSGGINLSWNVIHADADHHVLSYYDGGTFEFSIIDRQMNGDPKYSTRFILSPWERQKIGQYYYKEFIDYRSAHFISRSKGWIAARYERSSNGPDQDKFPHGIRIYEVNDNASVLLTTIEGFGLTPSQILFRNGSEGFVLGYRRYDNLGYVFKTVDGGQTWARVYSLEYPPRKIMFLDAATILMECDDGYLQSADNGNTWTLIPSSKNIIWTTVDQDGLLYALERVDNDTYGAICKMNLSKDKGLTWEPVDGKAFYGNRISFFDRFHGIAYSHNILQYTDNGGKTWHLLVFPLTI